MEKKKKVITIVSVVLSVLFVAVIVLSIYIPLMNDAVVVDFADTNDVLLNPGKGFVDYGNLGSVEGAQDYYSIGYHRFSWADIEPNENEYNFEKIDHKIESYQKRGKKFAFGVMCVNTSSSEEYITPKFVFDKGTPSFDTQLDSGGVQKVPDWESPIYLECVNNFVKALGERYNGNKNIAFIDILSYGNWGEQHLYHIEIEGYPNYKKEHSISAEFFKENYVKPYMEAFPDTLLFNLWGEEEFNEVYEELIDEGVSLRRDGIVYYTNGLDILAKCYGKLPVVFEYARNYKDYIPDREEHFNEELLQAMDVAKPSYIELDVDWFKNNKELCAELANKMGYYFRLKQAQYSKTIHRGRNTSMSLTFANDGIAPIYEKCLVYIGLMDENGKLVKKYLTNLNPKNWQPGQKVKENIQLNIGSGISAGNYTLTLGLFADEDDENPTFLLGSTGKLENRWYRLGNVKIS